MRGLKAVIILFTAGFVIYGFVDASRDKPAEAPKVFTRADSIGVAEYGCELWTRSHSKLSVSEVVARYELKGKTTKGHYRVGLDYRAGASGLLMHSRCEYVDLKDGHQLLLSASSSLD